MTGTIRRPWLMGLVPLYAGALRLKRQMFAAGRLRRRRLDHPVISIGSLSAGGAGKTPMVLLLAELLKRRSYEVRILTRGYGRASALIERVDPAGDPVRFGDEPVLMARRSGSPVYVGADRYRAGRMAEDMTPGDSLVYLLDDGFQHRRLARDLDVVLLTRKDVDDALLPAGDLREPLSALREADVVVLREDEAPGLRELVKGLTRDRQVRPIWEVRRRLVLPAESGSRMPERPLAFCGIARPDGFWSMLKAEGVEPAARLAFADHYRYAEPDIERLVGQGKALQADGVVTTEKDAVKLTRSMRSRLESLGPVVVPELRLELLNEKDAMEQMIRMVRRLDRRRSR